MCGALKKDYHSRTTSSLSDQSESSPVMAGQQRLLSFWALMLLVAALCPGAQYAYSKRGGIFRGKSGKSDGDKSSSPSQGRGLPKQGMKWAGAAAAGMLGGTGTGFGLKILGRPKHGSHHGHKTGSSGQHQQPHYQETQKYNNQSFWRSFVRGAAPAPMTSIFVTLGHVVPFLTTAWIRDI
ncbi:shadow of prion protein 2 [Cololabis saira]|uniref:shadow of prion protein 2 n=1 Tax=Cololabis saira TaxID=129043 RepID=UPI002AD2280B|nr:shadow of prion protein 2 [Cololabis saira]